MPKETKNAKILIKLFFTMLYISAFTFGGGFVIITFMKKIFVDKFQWIDEKEMLDLTALAQSSPGAIAVNASILIGWRTAGFGGMVVAVVATVLPPLIILSVISFFYAAFATNVYVDLLLKGMQAGVAAVILDVVFGLGGNVVKSKSIVHLVMMGVAFIATFFLHINVIYIILSGALIGVIIAFFGNKKDEGKE